ncbi:MAG: type VI secretion system tube protein Hcp [Deltaproteobacteria bacterium]|nr:type VI secretion system tube protein Hcp [Deltaproteobacteria bacterium]MBW1863674.1 type VI secretion system tube protein Hcp [Deltaproteobacteria bacterium]
MASDMFLLLDGIQGECEDSKHKNWIEILSWSHSFSQPTTPVRSSSGATVEKCNHSDISITKYVDNSTDALLSNIWNGNQIKTGKIQCLRADAETNSPVEYLTIELEKVILSNYSISGGGGDLPIENLSLSYGKVAYIYKDQKKDSGEGGSNKPVSHDLVTNEVGG